MVAVVVVDLDLAGMHAAEQIFLLLAQGLAAVLGAELERRVRLGHKAGDADRDLHALALRSIGDLIEQVHDLLRRVGNALDVVERFRRQTHHEVELDRGVPLREGDRGSRARSAPT